MRARREETNTTTQLTIVLADAAGNLGTRIAKALIGRGAIVRVLVRTRCPTPTMPSSPGAVHAAPAQGVGSRQVAMVAATPPSVASFIGVGGLSLIGMLALRRIGSGSGYRKDENVPGCVVKVEQVHSPGRADGDHDNQAEQGKKGGPKCGVR